MVESTEAVPNNFSILSDAVRRYALCSLDEQETPISFDRLATRVTTWHTDSDPDAVDDASLTYIGEEVDTCSKWGGSHPDPGRA